MAERPGEGDEEQRKISDFEREAREAEQRRAEEVAKGNEDLEVMDRLKHKDREHGSPHFSEYRPLQALNHVDYSELKNTKENPEKELVKEALRGEVLGTLLTLSQEIDAAIEGASAKQILYSAQHNHERSGQLVAQTQERRLSVKSGENSTIIGLVLREQVRTRSALTVHKWYLPYMATYWGGPESARLLSERGAQLPMAEMDRFMHGPQMKKTMDAAENLSAEAIDALPLVTVEKTHKEGTTVEAVLRTEKTRIKETTGDRLARYTAESEFWNKARGEMNTYNPVFGDKIYLSKAMQTFLVEVSQKQTRTAEDATEKLPESQARMITIYFDKEGRQVPQKKDADGVLKAGGYDKSVTFAIETLDYFNKASSEKDRKWVIATTAAMCIENAKKVLDSLPHNVDTMMDDEKSEDGKKYKDLIAAIKKRAQEIVDNYDDFDLDLFEQSLAKTAFNVSYGISFGSMGIEDRGWSNEWLLKGSDEGGYLWLLKDGTGSQGDPTASGDAFSARRPFFHDVAYEVIKARLSANTPGAGVLMTAAKPQGEDGLGSGGSTEVSLANALLSEAEEMNQRGRMLERLKNGEQSHVARFFGVIGAYENVLKGNQAWKDGEAIRNKTGKKANENLVKTIEETVMYVPTPFLRNGKTLYYPILLPQFQISLFDMLSVSKDISVGDLLRKTWKWETVEAPDGTKTKKRVEATPVEGGKRLTWQDIDWSQYAAYADDSHAVNDKFLWDVFGQIYGGFNSKVTESVVSNPMAAISMIIKAIDIGTRNYIKKLKGGETAKRQSFETMYASSILFQHLALGLHGVFGRGGIKRFKEFITEVTPNDKANRKPDNLYTVLRTVTDIIPEKQGYEHYSDGFFLVPLAFSEAIKPLVVASELVSRKSTMAMDSKDFLSLNKWNEVSKTEEKIIKPEQLESLDKFLE